MFQNRIWWVFSMGSEYNDTLSSLQDEEFHVAQAQRFCEGDLGAIAGFET